MLTGDDTPAPQGEADPGQGTSPEAPAATPDTPSPDELAVLQERYENLHSRFGSQGQELGTLRQRDSAREQELAELRAWREPQDRAKGLDQYERESSLNKLVRDPPAQIRAEVKAIIEEREREREARDAQVRQREKIESVNRMIGEFEREHEKDAKQHGAAIRDALEGIPFENITKKMLTAALKAAKLDAGERAEESAQKKVAALTRSAALPKGVASPKGGNAPSGKARNFDQAVSIAKAKAESGG